MKKLWQRRIRGEGNAHGVECLVVGTHALAAHGHVRATKHLDVWLRPDAQNAKRVLNAAALPCIM